MNNARRQIEQANRDINRRFEEAERRLKQAMEKPVNKFMK